MMKLRNFRTFAALLMPCLFIFWFVAWNLLNKSAPAYVFKVNIPKPFNADYSNEELWEYVESGNEIPFDEFKRRNLGIPNYDRFLYVSLEKNGSLRINNQNFGNLENTDQLSNKLSEVFREREEMKVLDENTNKVVKDVIVRASRSDKYANVVKVIDAVKISGTDPIILQIDGLPK
ncbi:MAG TPA: hypothetical protein PKY59_04085 [Pyrinomonadaceae bacterium]|nr:hypothetical protein [Pyrinomonadaceae bacterium]